ncbi:BTAD domain-containing putative transcriptional regulator [Kribbella sp. CWNU-51]
MAELVARNPLRQRLRAVQLKALHQAGRQAEPLASSADLRDRLREELGLRVLPAAARGSGRGRGGPATVRALLRRAGTAHRAAALRTQRAVRLPGRSLRRGRAASEIVAYGKAPADRDRAVGRRYADRRRGVRRQRPSDRARRWSAERPADVHPAGEVAGRWVHGRDVRPAGAR